MRSIEGEHMELESCEWVVVDEADVLLGPDFEQETRGLIDKITESRSAAGLPKSSIILSTATVPPSLSTVIKSDFPEMIKILSPNVHRLPNKLKTRFVAWSGSGNNLADVAHEVKRVFAIDAVERMSADEAMREKMEKSKGKGKAMGEEEEAEKMDKGRILVFCNTPSRAKMLEKVFEGKGISSVALTGEGEERVRGTNGALNDFLIKAGSGKQISAADPSIKSPRVLITTSLLSRGLDFSPSVKHVFLVDEPRDVLDFMHRAGRTGRAGRVGEVVVFGAGQRSILGQKTRPGEALTKFKKQLGGTVSGGGGSGGVGKTTRFAGPREITGRKSGSGPRPMIAQRAYSTSSTSASASASAATMTSPGATMYDHPAMEQLRTDLSATQPCFGARGDEIEVLLEPKMFHERLLKMIKSAKRRILISTLYIGTEQQDLVSRHFCNSTR